MQPIHCYEDYDFVKKGILNDLRNADSKYMSKINND